MAGLNPKAVVISPDKHFPHHDPVALEVFEKAHAAIKPGLTVDLGDIIDGSSFGTHGKRKLSEAEAADFIQTEIEPARKHHDRLLKNTAKVVQLEGNHEYRVERWAIANGFAGAAAFHALDPRRLLGDGRSRSEWQWIPYIDESKQVSGYRITKDLLAVHGWSFAKHAAHVHMERGRGMSVIFGHTHRMQYHVSRDHFHNRIIRAMTPGCLCKLQPLYTMGNQPPTEWVHGFAIVYVGRRSWSEYLVKIEGNSCVLPDGREIRV